MADPFETSGSGPSTEAYLRLLAQHERAVTAYVFALVPCNQDAEDLLQECKVVMWKHFASYQPDSDFLAWARKIALHQILNYRRKLQRRQTSTVDQTFIEAVAAEIDRKSDHLEKRSEALRQCLRKLPRPHQQAIVWRYYEDCEVEEIATKTGRTETAVYRLLSRIRQALNSCVTRTLSAS